ncbi:glycosyltransferase family 39 protein [Aneurinibacillus sp. Ricciae_BoGa-3]|uniref:ArnT family glycosyltransferase n=1 Tax=Aneurinibacillus sp. Ricciae_BoGa-3 TaxID=3022697 RepID=UPI00234086BE|nr:glycosyltransferase family 39 protein [Aneurinibacillus sp. Ricciae_BoGa-3]WCK54555.1 glycosyltransferase family 39 protein [Aneurinibacillus sp. Ricciae_BoGa-3]
MDQIKRRLKWHHFVLAVILLSSFILNFYRLGQEGYGNDYYAAAVKSMLENWHNCFFNSFDPKGFITIDKPPVGFWIQTISAYIFGFKGWSLFMPQALTGLLSVAVLYRLVTNVFGRGAGLLAALFLAFTPIVVATDRTNEVDSLLMFLTLIATWAINKAVERDSIKWLLFAFFLVGVGFNIKMMEAFLILPAFYLFYVKSVTSSWPKKLAHLLCATVVLAVVSFSWSFLVDTVPPNQRPYIGSTHTNSMMELAIGYNGINRLVGQHRQWGRLNLWSHLGFSQDQQQWSQTEGNGRNGNSDTSYTSAFSTSYSTSPHFPGMSSTTPSSLTRGEIGKPGILRLFITPQLNGQLSWFLPGLLFGVAALLWGTRLAGILDQKRQAVIFWSVWVFTMVIFFSVASNFSSYYMVMLAPGIAALAGAGFIEMWRQWCAGTARALLLPLALVCNTAFEISVVWKYPSLRIPVTIIVGILSLLALIGLAINATGERRPPILALLSAVITVLTAPAIWCYTPIEYRGAVSYPFAGPELQYNQEHEFMAINAKLENYLRANYREGSYLVATMNAKSAAPIFLHTHLPVMAMGGFMGSDPALSVRKLRTMASKDEIRYFLIPANPPAYQQTAVLNWIRDNCCVIPSTKWSDQDSSMRDMQSSWVLYEYVKKQKENSHGNSHSPFRYYSSL